MTSYTYLNSRDRNVSHQHTRETSKSSQDIATNSQNSPKNPPNREQQTVSAEEARVHKAKSEGNI